VAIFIVQKITILIFNLLNLHKILIFRNTLYYLYLYYLYLTTRLLNTGVKNNKTHINKDFLLSPKYLKPALSNDKAGFAVII